MALDLVGAGFGRTGTRSIKAALEQLGLGPCYHMFEVYENPSHVAVWQRAADGEAVDWDALFDGYRSAVDWPTCTFWKPLAERYPSAKVLLSVRDPERWYDSVMTTIHRSSTTPSNDRAREIFRRMVASVAWEGIFNGRMDEKAYVLDVLEKHIAEVKRRVPPERLLVYDVKEGWEPLCAFLGIEVPDGPFPRLNDKETFLQRMKERENESGS